MFTYELRMVSTNTIGRFRSAFFAVIWLILVISLTLPVWAAKVKKDSSVVVQIPQEPSVLNPYSEPFPSTLNICGALFSKLFDINDRYELVPDLATKLPISGSGMSKDGLIIRIPIRSKVKFHDGKPLSAGDIEFTFDSYILPKAGQPGFKGFEKVNFVKALDQQTIAFYLKEPWPGIFQALSSIFILPRHILEKHQNEAASSFWKSPVGSGPYAFKEWRPGQIKLKAFDEYYRGAPQIESLTFKVIVEETAVVSQLLSGDIDAASSVPVRYAKQLRASQSFKLYNTPTPTFEHLVFNFGTPALADKKVRKAIRCMIPMDHISQEVYQGEWKQVDNSGILLGVKSSKLHAYSYDQNEVRVLLDEAGWKIGNDGWRYKNGKRLVLNLTSTTGNRQRERVLEILRDEGKRFGIEFNIKTYPASRFFASKADGGIVDSGKYDIALYASGGSVEPDLYRMLHSSMVPPAGINAGRYKSAKADEFLEAWITQVEPKKHQELFVQLLDVVNDDLPIAPLFFWVRIDAVSARIHGAKPAGTTAGLLWNIWEWRLDE